MSMTPHGHRPFGAFSFVGVVHNPRYILWQNVMEFGIITAFAFNP